MNIVLSRLDRLGDLILSTPAIRTLRRTFPTATLSLICSRYNHEAVAHNRDIDTLYIAAPEEAPSAIGRRFQGADLGIALAPCSADLRCIAATRAARRIGYTYVRRWSMRAYARLLLTDCLISDADPVFSERDPNRPVQHEVEQLLQLAKTAGATELLPDLVLPLDPADRATVADLPSDNITIHLAPRWLQAGSTEASFRSLCTELRGFGRPLVVTYAPETAAIAARLGACADVVLGDLSFGAWAASFERAACVVTVDTGATHVASAMQRPTVVLFEHRNFALNSREWAPWRVPAAAIRKPADEHHDSLAASRQELCQAVGRLLNT